MIEVISVYVASGVFAGIVAAMFGVGGGFAVAPILLTLLTMQQSGGEHTMHLTVGTTQAVILVVSSYSAVLRWRAKDTNLQLVLKFFPLVAIGGINLENVAPVAEAGADAICVTAAVASAPEPEKAAHQMVEIIRQAGGKV